MAIVKAVKINPTGLQQEVDPSLDFLAASGIAFEGLNTYLLQKLGRSILFRTPDDSQKITYLPSGDIDFVEFFSSATQIVANRIAKVTIGYTGFDPTSETWLIYDLDGTTILKTILLTHTYSGSDLTQTVQVTT